MKKILIILFVLISCQLFSQNWYVDNTGTGDTLATLAEVNALTLGTADTVFLKRGCNWHERLLIAESGGAGIPIVFTSYGSGNKPIITGFSTLTVWTDYGDGDIYYSLVDCRTASILLIDGGDIAMGIEPDATWLNYEDYSTNTYIIDDELTNSPNWTGADIIIVKSPWTIERSPITNHTNTRVNYTTFSTWRPLFDDFGYRFTDDFKTLDNFGEWYYDGDTLFMYFGVEDPGDYDIEISTIDTLARADTRSYITFDSLAFEGAGNYAFYSEHCNYITFRNCTFRNMGRWAIRGRINANNVIEYDTFNTIYANAINLDLYGSNNTVRYNIINDIGTDPTMIYSDDDGGDGIVIKDSQDTVKYNRITNIGHSGIRFNNYSNYCMYNYIDTFGLTRADVGGIYTSEGSVGHAIGGVYYNNIVLNGDATDMWASGRFPHEYNYYELGYSGIYFDWYCTNMEVYNNTIGHISGFSFLSSGDNHINVHDNTFYNADYASILVFNILSGTWLMHEMRFDDNIFVTTDATRGWIGWIYTSQTPDDIPTMFTSFDNNYYARPLVTEDTIMRTFNQVNNWPGYYRTLANWQTYTSKDASSTMVAFKTADVDDVHFIYNDTTINKTFILSDTLTDCASTIYEDTIYITPFSSLVLFGVATISEETNPPDVVYPTVTTMTPTIVYTRLAIAGGNVTSDGGGTVSTRGVCWSTSANPTTSDSKIAHGTGTGAWTDYIPNLKANTTYHIRSYATNETGTVYGSDIEFTTPVHSVAKTGGKVLKTGGKTIILH